MRARLFISSASSSAQRIYFNFSFLPAHTRIRLRNEAEPYLGLVHCAKTIVNEEGFRALYRAWWVTLLGGLISALG